MSENELLITPAEVVSIAFGPQSGVGPGVVTPTTIRLCQQRFIKPVLNGLYQKMVEGGYEQFCERYVKPSLAHYVKLTVLPHLAYSIGSGGITSLRNSNLESCDQKTLGTLRKTVRREALALIRIAVEHVENNPDEFPEYDPKANILNSVNIGSQFVL